MGLGVVHPIRTIFFALTDGLPANTAQDVVSVANRPGITVPMFAKDNFVPTTVAGLTTGARIVLVEEWRRRRHRRVEEVVGIEEVEMGVEEIICLAPATDKVNPAIVVILNARQLRVVINKKVAGGAMMGDGNAMITLLLVVPGIGQLVLHHVAKVNKAMAVELPDGAIMAPVVPILLPRLFCCLRRLIRVCPDQA